MRPLSPGHCNTGFVALDNRDLPGLQWQSSEPDTDVLDALSRAQKQQNITFLDYELSYPFAKCLASS